MALGRGLEALIPTSSGKVSSRAISQNKERIKEQGEKVINVPVDKIEPNPFQPRKDFSHSSLEELINSIRAYGIIQPLILSPLDNGKYQIIAGERRFRAALFLEMKAVPAIVRQADQQAKLEIALLENIQRQDLNPIERAEAYLRLIEEFNLTQEQIAEHLGKSRSSIANSLRLLSLPLEVQEALKQGSISEGHGKILAGLENKEKQLLYFKRILGLNLSVRDTEKLIFAKKKKQSRNFIEQSFPLIDELSSLIGSKIRFFKKKNGGKLVFEFYSQSALENFLGKIKEIFKNKDYYEE